MKTEAPEKSVYVNIFQLRQAKRSRLCVTRPFRSDEGKKKHSLSLVVDIKAKTQLSFLCILIIDLLLKIVEKRWLPIGGAFKCIITSAY